MATRQGWGQPAAPYQPTVRSGRQRTTTTTRGPGGWGGNMPGSVVGPLTTTSPSRSDLANRPRPGTPPSQGGTTPGPGSGGGFGQPWGGYPAGVPGTSSGPPLGGGAGGGAAPGAGGTNFYEQARLLYPWLPEELLRIFADAMAQWNDPNIAWGAVRANPAYDRYFPGNRRPDGSFRLSEQEYMATIEGYGAVFGRYGLGGDMFTSRYVELVMGEVSVAELSERLGMTYTGLVDRMDDIRGFYADNYGLQLSNEAIFASAIDPQLEENILAGRITNAQIGGWARFYGFGQQARGDTRELDRIDQLRQLGVTEQAAQRTYARAAFEVPQLGEFARRYGDREGFDIEAYEGVGFLADPNDTRRRQNLIGRERSAFSQAAGFSRDRAGAFSGLVAR